MNENVRDGEHLHVGVLEGVDALLELDVVIGEFGLGHQLAEWGRRGLEQGHRHLLASLAELLLQHLLRAVGEWGEGCPVLDVSISMLISSSGGTVRNILAECLKLIHCPNSLNVIAVREHLVLAAPGLER